MPFLTDKEVAVIVGVSPSTITRIMNGCFGGKCRQPLLRVRTIRVGGGRRWDVKSLCEVLGKTEEEIGAMFK